MPILISGHPAQDLRLEYSRSSQAPQAESQGAAVIVQEKTTPPSPEDQIFQKKFAQTRKSLNEFLSRAPSAVGQDHELILKAFQTHLQEISPKHRCQRYEVIKTAKGWVVFLQNFISDRQKLEDALHKADYAPFLAEVAEENARIRADYAQQKKEKAREKELARRGFHSS